VALPKSWLMGLMLLPFLSPWVALLVSKRGFTFEINGTKYLVEELINSTDRYWYI
jgi:hypothetical protein